MALLSAKEFLANPVNTPLLGDTAPDSVQPRATFGNKDFFAFGVQPTATRNAGKSEKVGVVGAGDVWEKFIMPSLVQRGSEVHVYDKKFEASCYIEYQTKLTEAHAEKLGIPEPEMAKHLGKLIIPEQAEKLAAYERAHFMALVEKAGAQDRIHIVQGGVEQLPDDVTYIAVLTPPSRHLDVIKQAMKKGVPIAVEKPLVATKAQADELEHMLSDKPYPLYCIDWQVMHALPVLEASGMKVPFADALQTQVHDAAAYAEFKQSFDLKKITKIDARFVEGGGNQLGDIDVAMQKRPELFDYEKGGGMLFDLAVHPMNVLAALGFKATGIDEAFLGKPKRGEDGQLIPGVYERFGMEVGKKSGETYGRALMHMGIEGGQQDIDTTIEVAKGAASNDGRLVLSDGRYELRWEMFPGEQSGIGSVLEIKDLSKGGKIIATSTLPTDCYALIMQDISNFARSGSTDAPYFPEHRDMIYAIADIHHHARSQTIPAGEEVRQLKLDERPGFMHRTTPPRNATIPDGTGFARTGKTD